MSFLLLLGDHHRVCTQHMGVYMKDRKEQSGIGHTLMYLLIVNQNQVRPASEISEYSGQLLTPVI